MSDKVKHEKGEFQIEVPKDLPFGVGGLVGGFVHYLNDVDTNHDGKSDVAQVAPFVIKALPVLIELYKLVDKDKFKAWFLSHDFIDEAKAATHIAELAKIADEAGKLAPKP